MGKGWLGSMLIGCIALAPVGNGRISDREIIERVYQNRQELKLCDWDIDLSVSRSNSAVYRLDNNKYLVQFLCFMGAYQGNYEYYLYRHDNNQGKITPLTLDIIGDGRAKTPVKSIAGLPEYDKSRKTLIVYTKYRGLGDCGSLARYRWSNNRFQLVQYREKNQCDGKFIEPERYSLLYPFN